jgi:uncharacterized protein YqjF (DUF2071 family)
VRFIWEDLLFAHWSLPKAVLRPLVPPAVELDLFDDRAWVGIVPFRMRNVRLRGLPPIPGTGAFPELNVRTYVRAAGTPGVWFFSLDAASRPVVWIARRWFHLPYYNARFRVGVRDTEVTYVIERRHRGAPRAALDARYGPSGEETATPGAGTIEHWLTERYCLFAADPQGRLWRGDIHHHPWPLQPAWAELRHNTMARAAGISLPDSPALLHFARLLDVRAWALTKV